MNMIQSINPWLQKIKTRILNLSNAIKIEEQKNRKQKYKICTTKVKNVYRCFRLLLIFMQWAGGRNYVTIS